MNGPIEETYFNWLCAKVRENSGSNHFNLFKILHKTEFVWTVVGDRNRSADGMELREYFCNAAYVRPEPLWFNEPCSIFEMLIAFADRAEFQTDRSLREWFWIFMTNLNLDGYRRVSRSDEDQIHDILETFIWRLYDERGEGGLFPLRNPTRNDQRKIELWYQFFEWMDDQGIF